MEYLRERRLDLLITSLTQPVLGICVGMQLMCESSEENDTTCMGVFPCKVRRFSGGVKVPHVGWSELKERKGALFAELPVAPFVYFVHSYYAEVCEETSATAEYGVQFSAAISKGNFHGVQFHAEKSAAVGEAILRNFLKG
jgi:glutamine amidotransferase